jgi:hypothetical protein
MCTKLLLLLHKIQEFETKQKAVQRYNHYCNFEGEESRTYHQTSSSFLRVRRAAQVVRGSR